METSSRDLNLRLLVLTSSSLAIVGASINLFPTRLYLEYLAFTYILFGSMFSIFIEISPYLHENFIKVLFPFLNDLYTRSYLYLIMGSFCFGGQGIIISLAGLFFIFTSFIVFYIHFRRSGPDSDPAKTTLSSGHYGI